MSKTVCVPFVSSKVNTSVNDLPARLAFGGKPKTPVVSLPDDTIPVIVNVTSAARAGEQTATKNPTMSGEVVKQG